MSWTTGLSDERASSYTLRREQLSIFDLSKLASGKRHMQAEQCTCACALPCLPVVSSDTTPQSDAAAQPPHSRRSGPAAPRPAGPASSGHLLLVTWPPAAPVCPLQRHAASGFPPKPLQTTLFLQHVKNLLFSNSNCSWSRATSVPQTYESLGAGRPLPSQQTNTPTLLSADEDLHILNSSLTKSRDSLLHTLKFPFWYLTLKETLRASTVEDTALHLRIGFFSSKPLPKCDFTRLACPSTGEIPEVTPSSAPVLYGGFLQPRNHQGQSRAAPSCTLTSKEAIPERKRVCWRHTICKQQNARSKETAAQAPLWGSRCCSGIS